MGRGGQKIWIFVLRNMFVVPNIVISCVLYVVYTEYYWHKIKTMAALVNVHETKSRTHSSWRTIDVARIFRSILGTTVQRNIFWIISQNAILYHFAWSFFVAVLKRYTLIEPYDSVSLINRIVYAGFDLKRFENVGWRTDRSRKPLSFEINTQSS